MINVSKPIIEKEEIDAVMEVMKSGMLAQGPRVKELENEFAKFCEADFAVAFNSGTAAIHSGLYALGVKAGDEVITTPFTFVATANPILMLGAKVVFCDIREDDFNIDPDKAEEKITQNTKAILPVDLFGQVYDYNKLEKISAGHNLKILEDACQAVGAEQSGKKAGKFGNIGAFSLYATKNIMSGEGGVVVTDDEDLAEKCRRFRHHGQSEQTKYEYWDIGFNYRMMDLQAAIGLAQLKKVEIFNAKRIENAKKLSHELADIKGLVLPQVLEGNKHVFHQYTIRVTENFKSTRAEFTAYLKEQGIGSGIYYPKPLHLHPHFLKMGFKEGDFPVAERLSTEVLSLPVHPSLTEDELNLIINSIKNYAK